MPLTTARGDPGPATSRHPCGKKRPARHASQRVSAGSPCLHSRTQRMWAVDCNYLPQGRAAGRGRSPNPQTPLTTGQGAPPPPRRATSGQPCGTQRLAGQEGQGASQCQGPGLHTRTHSMRAADPDCLLQDGQPAEGEHLLQDAPHNSARSPFPWQPPATPAARNAEQGKHTKGQAHA